MCVAILLCLYGHLLAGPILIIPAPPTPKPDTSCLAKEGEYKSALCDMGRVVNDIVDMKKYADKEIEVGGKKVLFKDLDSFQQHMIVMVQVHRLSDGMKDLYTKWSSYEVATLAVEALKDVDLPEGAPSAKSLEKLIAELKVLRKKHAKNHESFAEQTVQKFKDKIPQTDAEYYLSQLKERHDKEDLVKRDE